MSALRRAFLVVLALRYLPTGLLLPVVVLLMLDRGLSLADVGVAMAAQGAVILLLELPTGGLADAVGSRAVLALAGAFAVTGTGLLLAADDLPGFLLAWGVIGVYRALDSGPLEASYVDAALAAEPGRDLERDLSLAGVIIAFYTVHGSLNAAHAALVHRRTPSGSRATVLSLNSLLSRIGALPAGIALGALADQSGTWAFLVTAGLLLLAAPLYIASGEERLADRPTTRMAS